MHAAATLAQMRQSSPPAAEPGCDGGVRMVQLAVCRRYNVALHVLLSPRRGRNVALVRHVAIWLCDALTSLSLPTLGRLFQRDHTTIIHAIRRIDALMRKDPEFDAEMRALRLALTPKTGEPQ